MSTPVIIAIAGCVLGAIQVGVGVALGMWLRGPGSASREPDLQHARTLALQLHGLTRQVGGSIAEHRTRFESAEQRLRDVPTGKRNPTTELVVGVVSEILQANRQLQAELKEAEDRIAEQAKEIESHLNCSLTDPLTDLPNRRALDEQLARQLVDYRKNGTPFSLLMFDLDHFKQINDTFGHPVGDEVLVAVGPELRRVLRKNDFIARYGGEEFAVVMPYTTLEESQWAANKASQGIALLSEKFSHLGQPLTVSGGLAAITAGEDAASLLQRADEALYAAKRGGRHCTYLHDGERCARVDVHQLPQVPRANAPERAAPAAPSPADISEHSPELADACGKLRETMIETLEPVSVQARNF